MQRYNAVVSVVTKNQKHALKKKGNICPSRRTQKKKNRQKYAKQEHAREKKPLLTPPSSSLMTPKRFCQNHAVYSPLAFISNSNSKYPQGLLLYVRLRVRAFRPPRGIAVLKKIPAFFQAPALASYFFLQELQMLSVAVFKGKRIAPEPAAYIRRLSPRPDLHFAGLVDGREAVVLASLLADLGDFAFAGHVVEELRVQCPAPEARACVFGAHVGVGMGVRVLVRGW
jgi:hypothetical protein